MIEQVSKLLEQAEQSRQEPNEEEEAWENATDRDKALLGIATTGITILSHILRDYSVYLDTNEAEGAHAYGAFLEDECGFDLTETIVDAAIEIKKNPDRLDLLIYHDIITNKCNDSDETLLSLCLFLGGIVHFFNYLTIFNSTGGIMSWATLLSEENEDD